MSPVAAKLQQSPLSAINGNSPPLTCYTGRSTPQIPKWRLRRNGDARLLAPKAQDNGFLVLAKDNGYSARGSKKEVIMVDPLEAKRIAAREMEEIRAKEKFERKQRAEAINGAFAMLGLVAALVIEGQTGKGIFGQLYGYMDSIISFLLSIYPRDLN